MLKTELDRIESFVLYMRTHAHIICARYFVIFSLLAEEQRKKGT